MLFALVFKDSQYIKISNSAAHHFCAGFNKSVSFWFAHVNTHSDRNTKFIHCASVWSHDGKGLSIAQCSSFEKAYGGFMTPIMSIRQQKEYVYFNSGSCFNSDQINYFQEMG